MKLRDLFKDTGRSGHLDATAAAGLQFKARGLKCPACGYKPSDKDKMDADTKLAEILDRVELAECQLRLDDEMFIVCTECATVLLSPNAEHDVKLVDEVDISEKIDALKVDTPAVRDLIEKLTIMFMLVSAVKDDREQMAHTTVKALDDLIASMLRQVFDDTQGYSWALMVAPPGHGRGVIVPSVHNENYERLMHMACGLHKSLKKRCDDARKEDNT